MKKFGMSKHKLLQTWLTSSKEETSVLIKELGLPNEVTSNQNQFFQYLNKFEAEVESGMHSQNQPSSNSRGERVEEEHGNFDAKKRQQIDAWLEMSDAKLSDECKRLGLPVSDQQIVNMKTLTEHLDSEIALQKQRSSGQKDNSAFGSIKSFFGME